MVISSLKDQKVQERKKVQKRVSKKKKVQK